MHIFIVDDDYELAELVANALMQAGHAIELCRTLEDARPLLREQSYDLALIDMYLPDGTGLDLLSYLRALRPEMPVIMLSARLDLGARLHGDRSASYMRKPLVINELLSRVRSLTRGRLAPAV